MCFLKLKENSFFGGVNSTFIRLHGATIKRTMWRVIRTLYFAYKQVKFFFSLLDGV